MSGREKPMPDAIVWDESSSDRDIFVDYQPGNCTRYLCRIAKLDLSPRALMALGFAGDEPDGVFEFAWLNSSRGGKAAVFRDAGFLHASYLAERTGCGLGDAGVLAELIAHYTKRTAESTALEATPRPCPACDGTGQIAGIVSTTVCSECDGEGVQRLST